MRYCTVGLTSYNKLPANSNRMQLIGYVVFMCLLSGCNHVLAHSTDHATTDREREVDTSPNLQLKHSKKSMSVLLVTPAYASHMTRIAPLGEELMRRGHNVTLCTTEREGDTLPQQLAKRVGMNWLSAGPDVLKSRADEMDLSIQARKNPIRTAMKAFELGFEIAMRIAKKLKSDPSYASTWDIIVADILVARVLSCLTFRWGIPIIAFHTTIDLYPTNSPPWPYPVAPLVYSDNLTTLQRYQSQYFKVLGYLLSWYFRSPHSPSSELQCAEYYYQMNNVIEGYVPAIVPVAFGFEFPRPFLPTMHYVGPLLLRPQEMESGDLKEWLESKKEKSVIYISMGTTTALTKELCATFIRVALQVDYSILWSLKASHCKFQEGISLDDLEERVYISSWVPQQEVLQDKAIKLAVVHGGMGGVSEALYYAVPLVVIPFSNDQPLLAARVKHTGAGVHLDANTLTTDSLLNAIETVSSPEYEAAAKRIRKIFLHAGGAERAADLVEFYQEVGYDHLIPAYLKYKWSWVQYYNLDRYVILSCILLCITMTTMFIVIRVCKLCCKRKVKQD